MPLLELNLIAGQSTLPGDLRSLLREAGKRVRRFRREQHVPGFVPSDFRQVYHYLRALANTELLAGSHFCEWGSGFGVVTCLAAALGFEACGIEIEPALVEAAQQLADDFELPAEFVCGSFIPRGATPAADAFSWLTTSAATEFESPAFEPQDFDVIFAYPWPDEELLVEDLFERFAAEGAVLITYQEIQGVRVRRKAARLPDRGERGTDVPRLSLGQPGD